MDIVQIFRFYGKNYTAGNLVAYKDNEIKLMSQTIELAWRENKVRISCIPEGIYHVKPFKSPSKGKVFLVENVPGRTMIEIHTGNYVAGKKVDLLGCIAPASYVKDINGDGYLDGVSSRQILNELFELYPNGFELHISKSKDII